jgi:methylamine--corrinoid protein Co-methyltransferase
MFYETAAQAVGDTVTGRDILIGPVGRRGAVADHSSGLESRFLGEIARMSSNLTLAEADELVCRIYNRYGERLADPPGGKPFEACYHVESPYRMRPTDSYLALYKQIISELKAIFL